jgi:AraC-like DNA-binding protein
MIREPEIIDQLSRSEEYQDFERAFCETTQLSLRLRSLESCDLAGDGEGQQAQITDVKAVPVRLGDKTIGVLELGLPDQERTETELFEGRPEQIRNAGANNDLESIDHPYFRLIVSDRARYKAMARLLEIFAKQLSFSANQILIQQAEREPYRVRLARAYIERHQTENLSLPEVAKVIHVSPFYFCKIFKKATGLTLVDFRNRLRIESAKRLLTVPGPGVSEIAYQVGFQSLTQFNRLFRRIVGKSPTGFRRSLLKAGCHAGQATSVN